MILVNSQILSLWYNFGAQQHMKKDRNSIELNFWPYQFEFIKAKLLLPGAVNSPLFNVILHMIMILAGKCICGQYQCLLFHIAHAEFFSENIRLCIDNFNYFSRFKWHIQLRAFLVDNSGPLILYAKYHCYWWPGDTGSQGISNQQPWYWSALKQKQMFLSTSRVTSRPCRA